jgi:hypothetical protein
MLEGQPRISTEASQSSCFGPQPSIEDLVLQQQSALHIHSHIKNTQASHCIMSVTGLC